MKLTLERAWALLMLLTGLSVAVSYGLHTPLTRLAAGLGVALLAALKGQILIRRYLESHEALPVVHRGVLLFSVLAPALLAACAWHEYLGGP